MSDLADKIIKRLEEFADQLKRGERIMCVTLERCGCKGEYKKCAGCRGTGFIRNVKNFVRE